MALFIFFLIFAGIFFYLFIKGKYRLSPLWLMLSAWMVAFGAPRLNLSRIEKDWGGEFWGLLIVSLISFALGFFVADKIFIKYPFWRKWKILNRPNVSAKALRVTIYTFFALSLVALYMFYSRVGNFPLLAPDPDQFRFTADEQVPGLINYTAQLARLFIPLAFFLMFYQGFSWRKHLDLIILSLLGVTVLTLFASRTQIFFIDLWVMALYLFIRKPNLKQALKFYPVFLLISVVVLAAVPLVRQQKSYGPGYLAGVTEIDTRNFPPGASLLVPIYVGVSFNQQALLHAKDYYKTHETQKGKVTLDPFTNIVGLDQYKPNFDLGAIFKPWWNTGTYLFPFVQDFGTAAFFVIPAVIAFLLTLLWKFWKDQPNFLSINLYAYACFFVVMTIYLSFTVRAEMYIDLFLIFMVYLIVSKKALNHV